MPRVYGGIEAGGTKFVCAVGTGPDDLRSEIRFPTTSPGETLRRAVEFFRERKSEFELAALGIGSFGPVDLREGSETYGFITATPKPGWSNTNVAGALRDAVGVPVAFDTDVNAAALAEKRWGAAAGLRDFIYLTIGTGIGGGGMANGELMHGLTHPEMGHIRIPRAGGDPYPGRCPFHGDCFEGLACGPAMEERWGCSPETLPEDHPAWELEARYIALALANYVCTLSPKRVIIGGGVMRRECLFPMVREKLKELIAGYVRAPELLSDTEGYVVPPALGGRAGVLGAIALAEARWPAGGASNV